MALVVGGILTAVLVVPVGSQELYWLPLLTGATYLAAALAGGRRGAFWAPAAVVGVFGLIAVLVLGKHVTDPVATGSWETIAVGVGLVVALVLQRAGFAVDLLGVALAGIILSVFLYLVDKAPQDGFFVKAWPYGVLLVVWGIWELRPARRAGSQG